MRQFTVLGFIKCGQQSMVKYLADQVGINNVFRLELLWRTDAVDVWKKHLEQYPDTYPIIITRNPVARIWSEYFYFKYDEKMSLEEYLEFVGYDNYLGELNPIKRSNYQKYIAPFLQYNPIILKLEDMMKIDTFPKMNITAEQESKNWRKPTMLETNQIFFKIYHEKMGDF